MFEFLNGNYIKLEDLPDKSLGRVKIAQSVKKKESYFS